MTDMIDQLNKSLLCDEPAPRRRRAVARKLINPATEEAFHEVFDATAEDIDRAAKSAFAAWEGGWRDLAPGDRADLLYKLASLIEERAAELGELESKSMGKPLLSAQGEAVSGGRTFRYYAGAIGRANGEVIPVGRGGFDFTLRQPMGVVACIVPWNFPLAIACWKVAPALAMGNCVLLSRNADATRRPRAGTAGAGSGDSAGRVPGALWPGRSDRRRTGHTSAGAESFFHRIDRHRAARDGKSGARFQTPLAGAGRQVSEHRFRG